MWLPRPHEQEETGRLAVYVYIRLYFLTKFQHPTMYKQALFFGVSDPVINRF